MEDILRKIYQFSHAVWLRRWYALIIAWAFAMGGWLIISQIHSKYYTEALLQVDSDSILRPLLKGLAVETDAEQRAHQITQALLSRPILEKLAYEMKFITADTNPKAVSSIISSLNNRIDIRTPSQHNKKNDNLYVIGYTDVDPARSYKVTQTLVNYLVQGSVGATKDESDAAQTFLQTKIKEYEERLSGAEKRLADFKQKNIGMMPGQGGGFYNRLQQSIEKLDDLKEKHKIAQEKLEQLKSQEKILAQTSTLNVIENEISKKKDELNRLLLTYTPEHPDVIALQQIIAQLENRKSVPMSRSELDQALSTNQVYQNALIMINDAELQVTSIASQIKEQEKRIEDLKKLVNTIPHVEAEMSKLDRDYNIIKEEHDALVARLQSAKLSDAADQSSTNLKFRLIDPPVAPLSPVSPKRGLLITLMLFVSIAAGLGGAYALYILKPVYSTVYDLNLDTGLPVLGAVTYVCSESEILRHKLEKKNIIYGASGLLAMYLFMLILQVTFL